MSKVNQPTTNIKKEQKLESALEQQTVSNENNENWQIHKKCVKDRIAYLLFSKILSDVVFIVGTERDLVHAHKFILSCSSIVFDKMFFGALPICSQEVEIPDIETVSFKNMLTYLYTDQVLLKPDNVTMTLYCAKKYAILGLEQHCVEFLKNNLNTNNAFVLLSQAHFFDADELADHCVSLIMRRTYACTKSESFVDVDIDTLEYILKREILEIREYFLYKALVVWANVECDRNELCKNVENRRKVLKHLPKLINYSFMSIKEFNKGPAKDGLLDEEDLSKYYLFCEDYRSPKNEMKPNINESNNRAWDVGSTWGPHAPSASDLTKADK